MQRSHHSAYSHQVLRLNLAWGDFETAHQPIQAFGDHIPGREIFAYIIAVWLVVGGAAILWRPTARASAGALAVVYFIFAVFWLPRFYTAPHVLGFRIPVFIGVLVRIPVFIGVLGGVAQQLILIAAGVIVYASLATHGSSWRQRAALIARWIFGFCSVDFGLAHVTGVQVTMAAACGGRRAILLIIERDLFGCRFRDNA